MLDIALFIPSVTVREMTNDIFTEDDLLETHDLSLGGITPTPQTATANRYCSALVSDFPLAMHTGQID